MHYKTQLGLLLGGEGGDVLVPAGDIGVPGGIGGGADKVQQLDISLGGLESATHTHTHTHTHTNIVIFATQERVRHSGPSREGEGERDKHTPRRSWR